jgi:spore germination protein KA
LIDNKYDLRNYIEVLKKEIGTQGFMTIKHVVLGNEQPVDLALVYVEGLVDKSIIDRDVLQPLMINTNIELSDNANIADYLAKRYIMTKTTITSNINEALANIKRGFSVIFVNNQPNFIIIDTKGGSYRAIEESSVETAARAPKESFVENMGTNLSMIRRAIKDKNLVFERFILGRRTQTDVCVIYLEDVVDKDVLNEIKERINTLDMDFASSSGFIEQLIEDNTYSIFPQLYSTERLDKVVSRILEGRVAILVDGTPISISAPALFMEFFHSVEDYYDRFIVTNAFRIIRFLAIFIVITSAPAYLVLIKFNSELIPVNFLIPIMQSRMDRALSPFLEIFLMELIIEFLREGGLRLPSKIAQTLSVVGGIIVGDMAVESRIVSPTTLFVVGVSVVASFVTPNYEMSLSIRFIRFPMLVLANLLGMLGIALGWFSLILHLLSLKSFGVPYFSVNKYKDLQDGFTRAPAWKIKERPQGIPHEDNVRQINNRKGLWRKRK